jgi:hypothetical protein
MNIKTLSATFKRVVNSVKTAYNYTVAPPDFNVGCRVYNVIHMEAGTVRSTYLAGDGEYRYTIDWESRIADGFPAIVTRTNRACEEIVRIDDIMAS